jgi:hypothetical protein
MKSAPIQRLITDLLITDSNSQVFDLVI